MRKIPIFAVALVVMMSGCGSSTGSTTASSTASSAASVSSQSSSASDTAGTQSQTSGAAETLPVPEDAGELEKAYIEELSKLLPAISRIQDTQIAAATDPEQAQQTIDALKEEYIKLGALETPPKYRQAQEKIKECSMALIELIDYTQEVVNLTEEELTAEKAQEAVAHMELLSNTAADALEAATKMIWGEDGAPSSEPEENTTVTSSDAN